MPNNSIVDYLKSSGGDSSLSGRAKLATEYGYVNSESEYLNLASQGKNADINTKLLGALQSNQQPSTTSVRGPSSRDTIGNVSQFSQNTLTGSDMERSAGLPEPTNWLETNSGISLNDRVSQVAKSTLNSNQLEIDRLRGELQSMNEKEKQAAEARVNKLEGQVEEFVGTTAAQDALEASNKKFKVEENIALYSEIQSKIVAAQEALEMGLIYEKDRPARMKFITGAESTLQKQGLATIGALQGTAAVIKGNLDLARAFGDATVNAINQDNEMSFRALTTLLSLAQDDLVDLTDRERTLIDTRLSSIEAESQRIQENKDKVLDLMTNYPKAFQAGGVTLLDSREEALRKMLPTMAEDERRAFEASLSTGGGSASGAEAEVFKGQLLAAKNAGMTYDEAILAFGDVLSVDYIREIFGRDQSTSGEDAVTDAYYNQFVNPDGSMKPGYAVSIDPKNGRPIVTQKSETDDSSGFWSNIGQAWNTLWGG